jgi:hypothetical protein
MKTNMENKELKCMIGQGNHIIAVFKDKETAIKFIEEKLFPNNSKINPVYELNYNFHKPDIWIRECKPVEFPFEESEDPKEFKELTAEEALERAKYYGLEAEIQTCLDKGMSPIEACREWDV